MKWFLFFVGLLLISGLCLADDTTTEEEAEIKVDQDIGSSREGSRTDDEVVQREEEAIKLDGLNVAQVKELREKAEKFVFQAEVNRMMKLIINSLYRNKEIFLRELISNASDALDKIRLLSLTENEALSATEELSIKIKLNFSFQFGVGFYSAFLVADRVVVTSKHNDDKQYIWESDSGSFSIVEDPRGDTLKRGTTVSLYLKEEARDFLEEDTLKQLIKKYSQFINFNIYLWTSKTETVEEPVEEDEEEDVIKEKPDGEETEEDGKVEEEKEEKPKTKKVEKTTWDWELMNSSKPIWQRKPADINEDEYKDFYKSITKDTSDPLTKTHFIAEGEVTFKSVLYIPSSQPTETFNRYGSKVDHIKLYVRRVFITDDFQDMMPNYLNFIRGVVDSDDLPLNVSRETLQQHKLLKVIKKKLVRKTLDMIKKIPKEDYEKFWKEYSTNVKLGIIEDPTNRTRLAKLLRFISSNDPEKLTSLAEYVERMKEKQEHIYYIAGSSLEEVKKSPFVERLLKKGYEVLYLTEPVDEYSVSALPEFEGKKFQNAAKDGLKLDESGKAKERLEDLEKEYEPLTKWLQDESLKDKILKAKISQRLHNSPCALVASQFGWTGNMERLARSNAHSKTYDTTRDYYLSQKKTLEINPRHPLIKELKKRIEDDKDDPTAKNMANIMFETATLRSGYILDDTFSFAERVETLLRKTLGVPEDAQIEDEPELPEEEEEAEKEEEVDADDEGETEDKPEDHDEL
ncbi:endoplasmin-like [Limulus polyphemus]|uniref:Endoplasmin-like n=1 Tax=Limulus polyphemus TaxID=6850 RepID=A0ABM1T5L6_LIMPO|nr:endoplasmin-like [Limulus polyphemus]